MGGWKFLLEMGGSQEWDGGLILQWGGWENFKVFLHSWQKVLTLLFYGDPLPILPTPTPLFKILSTHPHPHFPVTSNPSPHSFICCHVSLAEWLIIPHLMCYFN